MQFLLFRFIDVNECAVNNGGCDQVCTNTQGSYPSAVVILDTTKLVINAMVCSQLASHARRSLDLVMRSNSPRTEIY